MQCSLRYGTTPLSLELPDAWDITVVRRAPMPAAPGPAACVADALDHPEGAADLAAEARGARSACIMICDATRPVPNGLLLRPVIERLLAAGLAPRAVTVLVATGLHRPSTAAELRRVLGDPWVADTVTVAEHDARDDAAHVLLGTTSRGVPVSIDRRVAAADIRVAVGLVEPHFMAGWSGGRKLVLPGCAHADTIMAFHAAAVLDHPRARAGTLAGNPVHEAQQEALALVGRTLAVSVVINDDRELAFASFGAADESLAAAVAFAAPRMQVAVPAAFPVVVSCGAGHPLDATYYQAVKGIVAGASILAPGGDLFVAAACGEGLGSASFRAAQARLRALGPAGLRAEAAGRARALVDEWQTFMLVGALETGRVHLFSEALSAEDHALTGASRVNDLRAAVTEAVLRSGSTRVAVIPEGPYAAPFVADAPGAGPISRPPGR